MCWCAWIYVCDRAWVVFSEFVRVIVLCCARCEVLMIWKYWYWNTISIILNLRMHSVIMIWYTMLRTFYCYYSLTYCFIIPVRKFLTNIQLISRQTTQLDYQITPSSLHGLTTVTSRWLVELMRYNCEVWYIEYQTLYQKCTIRLPHVDVNNNTLFGERN